MNSPCTHYVALLAQNMAVQWETARVISLDREGATAFLTLVTHHMKVLLQSHHSHRFIPARLRGNRLPTD